MSEEKTATITIQIEPGKKQRMEEFFEELECVSKCREMQFRADLAAFQGEFSAGLVGQ